MDNDKVNIGSIHIHKKVIAEVVSSALSEIRGVSLVAQNMAGKFLPLARTEGRIHP